MSDDFTIKLEHVSKKYCKNLKRSMVYGLMDIGRNLIGMSSRPDQLRKNEFWAVNDISFEVKRGETLGIIGPNGSGKTTLLKMLNGIFWPDKGKITVKGKIGALIAVGAGFHPQLSGWENIYINGAILGMSKKEIDKKFDAIVDFANIGDFLDTPVKHYSSGMFVRLGFAVAAHSEPDILLIDEVLAVGDINFQAKCFKKIKEMDDRGVTKIFISHNLNSVQQLCAKSLYISKGSLKFYGSTHSVINEFKKDALMQNGTNEKLDSGLRFGTREIELKKVEFLDKNNESKTIFKRGESLKLRIKFEAKEMIRNPEFSVAIETDQGVEVSRATTKDHSVFFDVDNGFGEICYNIKSLPFNIGQYAVSIGCYDETGHVAYDHHRRMYEFFIEDGAIQGKIQERAGLVYIPAQWDIHRAASK